MSKSDAIDINQHPRIKELRRLIDSLDAELLELFARRMEIIKEVGDYKKTHDLPALDEDRWVAMLKTRTEKAKRLGLSEDFMINLFELIHAYTLQIESDIKNQ